MFNLPAAQPARYGVEDAEHRRKNRKIFGDIVCNAEGGQRTTRHEQLFPDLDNLDQLGRIAVQIHHVPRFPRGLGACVHGDADIGLSQRGRVVRSVTDHGNQLTGSLFLANAFQFVFGLGLGNEIVHARFGGNGRRRQRLSPVIITVRMPILRNWANRSRIPPLTTSLRCTTPSA